MEADVSGAGEIVGDEVVGFNGDAVTGSSEVGPRGKVGADDVEGVTMWALRVNLLVVQQEK